MGGGVSFASDATPTELAGDLETSGELVEALVGKQLIQTSQLAITVASYSMKNC